jgi:hypothetical protein
MPCPFKLTYPVYRNRIFGGSIQKSIHFWPFGLISGKPSTVKKGKMPNVKTSKIQDLVAPKDKNTLRSKSENKTTSLCKNSRLSKVTRQLTEFWPHLQNAMG